MPYLWLQALYLSGQSADLGRSPLNTLRSLSLWYSQQDKTALSTYVFNGWDILFPPLPTVETFSICLIVGRSQVAILGLTMKYLLSSNLPGAIWNPRAFGLYHFYKNGPGNWSGNERREKKSRSDLKDQQARGPGLSVPRGQEGQHLSVSLTFISPECKNQTVPYRWGIVNFPFYVRKLRPGVLKWQTQLPHLISGRVRIGLFYSF